MSLYNELKRRNVFRVAIAYLAVAWLLTEVSGTLFPVFGIPDWGVRFVVIVFALGFVPALIISWAYELTPEGLKREQDVVRDASITHLTARRLDWITIGLIVAALAFIVADRLWLGPGTTERLSAPVEAVTDNVQISGPELQFPPNSIAVLPFVNMSADADNEYFSDGISEELLNLLAKIPELRVIARTSSFTYKGKDTKIPDIARELNVSHVLEGSVRKSGNQVRITAQLIRASDSTHLWSETYDRTLDNIFTIQDEIAVAVVGQLKITLLGDTPRTHAVDPDAYALFLQGRHFSNQGGPLEVQQKAIEFLQQALAVEPDYAAAWAELGRMYMNQVRFQQISQEEGYPKSLEALNKALELDPGNAIAYSRLGWNRLNNEGDLVAAAELIERAMALEPGNAIVLSNAASLARALGRTGLAVTLQELALQRDPVNSGIYSNLGWTYLVDGQLDKAETMFRKSLLLSPGRFGVQAMLARVLFHKGESYFDEAMQFIEKEPFVLMQLTAYSIFYHARGNSAESNAALQTLIKEYQQAAGSYIALVYAVRGDTDKALEWLQKAVEFEGPRVLMNSWYAPEFEILHADPRWEEMLTSAGLSQQQLATIKFELKLPE